MAVLPAHFCGKQVAQRIKRDTCKMAQDLKRHDQPPPGAETGRRLGAVKGHPQHAGSTREGLGTTVVPRGPESWVFPALPLG